MRRTTSIVIAAILLISLMAGCASSPASPTATGTPTETSPTVTATPSPTSTPEVTPTATASPTATAQPTPGNADTDAAVQAVVDYYTAINEQRYQDAYAFWANNGAASGQTFEQFSAGFANTVQTTILLDAVNETGSGSDSRVTVNLRLLSVINESNDTQSVPRYEGNVVLQPVSNAWKLVEGNLSAVTPSTDQPPVDVNSPEGTVNAYYTAINAKLYAKAYTYWNSLGKASQQTFAQFRQGFANTESVTVEIGTAQSEGAAGSIYATMPVTITATQTDGTTKIFSGTYTTRRANVPPFEQFGWHIETAQINETK